MKFFEHPIRAIREPFGTAGLVIAIVALIAALGGGAYAASGGLTGKEKTEVERIAKRFAGKRGAQGATGAQGVAGPAGATGVTGSPGASVLAETLPSGTTETGIWSVAVLGASELGLIPSSVGSISFPIPLAAAGGQESAFVFSRAQTAAGEFGNSGCSGSVQEPSAPPGVLCVFTNAEEEKNASGPLLAAGAGGGVFHGYGKSGVLLSGIVFSGVQDEPGRAVLNGTWAVTAP